MLPQDPYILLSFINTRLRDDYPSPEQLCEGLDIEWEELVARLAAAGFVYDENTNQFR